MGTTLVKNYIHIIFSTHKRQNLIAESFEKELYSYIAGICNSKKCTTIIVGGHRNHIHIFCKLSKKTTLVELVREIKSNSSKWLKTIESSLPQKIWQRGYGCFSVKKADSKILINYIKNQSQHHLNKDFKKEYTVLLKANKIEYNEKYLWD